MNFVRNLDSVEDNSGEDLKNTFIDNDYLDAGSIKRKINNVIKAHNVCFKILQNCTKTISTQIFEQFLIDP